MKETIGIVGLGVMGHGMSVNFLKKGYTVVVWNRTPEKADDLVSLGAARATSPGELAKNADIIFEVTANDVSSREVWTASDGILSGADSSKVLIASATLSIKWIDELITMCNSLEYTFLDIPLTGGRIGAETGTLTMLCGGDEAVIKRISPAFSAIAAKLFYFGSQGKGMRYKLILNYMQALHIVGFGTAMKLAKAHHLGLPKVADALVDRPGGVITAIARDRYFSEPEHVTFSIEWIVKDLTYAKEFAGSLDTPLLDDVLDEYKNALAKGFGDKDWASVNSLEET
jgi:3-hydroxyisobutyrate dehydrogenase-like beta-hydroxyacid dehydrogenase